MNARQLMYCKKYMESLKGDTTTTLVVKDVKKKHPSLKKEEILKVIYEFLDFGYIEFPYKIYESKEEGIQKTEKKTTSKDVYSSTQLFEMYIILSEIYIVSNGLCKLQLKSLMFNDKNKALKYLGYMKDDYPDYVTLTNGEHHVTVKQIQDLFKKFNPKDLLEVAEVVSGIAPDNFKNAYPHLTIEDKEISNGVYEYNIVFDSTLQSLIEVNMMFQDMERFGYEIKSEKTKKIAETRLDIASRVNKKERLSFESNKLK